MALVRDKDHIALFNMPLVDTKPYGHDLFIDHFSTSVKMSTYLVAFVICDFENITSRTNSGVQVSVYAPAEQISQAKFALQGAVSVLESYDTFFGVPYPLPKQDLIAIPDFAAGAMENWGLITYRMTAILYDPDVTSLGGKQWVATVIAHELAHQWFGNLVTMTWWDDLWLNEGFATYVEYIGANAIEPDFQMNAQFVIDELLKAMYLDSMSNSHAIHVPVHHPNEINEIFDEISYSKGGSVLRMLRSILGEKNFNKGLTSYLKLHKYGNARTADLWTALQNVNGIAGVDVTEVMNTWTKQMGYPVVTVIQQGRQLFLDQERFLVNPASVNDAVPVSPYNYKWYIPFTMITNVDTATQHLTWMNKSSGETTIPSGVKWIKANSGMNGFYRVNYDPSNWQALIQQLKDDHTVFSPEDRAGLIDDAFQLARAGLISQIVPLDLSLYLKNEHHYVPWKAASDNLKYFNNLLYFKEEYYNFKKYILSIIDDQLNSIGWNDEGDHLQRFLRGLLLNWAVKMGHKSAIENGKRIFNDWMTNNVSINPNLKHVVYRTGVEYGDESHWRRCWDVYDSTNIPSEKEQMLKAMGHTKEIHLLTQYLQATLNKTKIRSQDFNTVVGSVAQNPTGQVLAWRFVQQHWAVIQERYSAGAFGMSRLIKGVSSHFTTQFDYDEVKTFFAKRDVGAGTRAVKQSLEKIKMNMDWLDTHEQEISNWLMKNFSN